MSAYDVVVVGSGLSGSILARKIAEEQNKKVRVVERRDHIGGNIYDEVDEYGIRIQRYGPHTFHTDLKEVYEFVEKYTELMPYRIKCSAVIDGVLTPSPFNYTTIHQFYEKEKAEELIHLLKKSYKKEQIPITELLESKDREIKEFATMLFEKDYRLYTAKQWGIPAEEIDSSVLKRVPVLLSYRDYIYEEAYEAVPKNGFTDLIKNLLQHENIQVRLKNDALEEIEINPASREVKYQGREVPIIFTGPIDALFHYYYGKMPYRSLDIKYRYFVQQEVQKTTLVVHPQHHSYTRTTEYTKLPEQKKQNITVVGYEYPCEYDKDPLQGNEPYYPIITEKNIRRYEQYKEYAKQFRNLILCGRLADYKYYNMEQAIAHALEVYKNMKFD